MPLISTIKLFRQNWHLKALANAKPLLSPLWLIVISCFINHGIPDKEYKMAMTSFAGYLAYQLICNVSSLTSFYNPVPQELRSLGITAHPEEVTLSHGTQESASLLTSGEKVFLSLPALKDANQVLHHQIAYE
jgi:hypothetical protein